MMSDMQLRCIYNMFTDCWKMYRQFGDIQQSNDMAWGNLIEEADAIVKRYESSRFARDLVTSVLSELERKSKGCGDNDR